MNNVIIIGGGASGMMAAIAAARAGAKVTILEHNERVGKKILSTGNGRCNFTNTAQEPIFYHSDNLSFPWKAVEAFGVRQTIAFFTELGVYSKNKNGYLYPYSEQASAVLDVLRMELKRLGVEEHCQEHVTAIQKNAGGFKTISEYKGGKRKEEHSYKSQTVVLASGSKAAPVTGSDGSGYRLAKACGHTMIPVHPALTQLRCREAFYKSLSGVRIWGKVSLVTDGKLEAEDTGEIQMTNYGISGIPVFQVSRYASKAIYEKKAVKAVLDFMPDFSDEQFVAYLEHRACTRPERPMDSFFTGLFHKKIALLLLKLAGIKGDRTADSMTPDDINALAHCVKHFSTEIEKTNSFEQAQVCAGGVDTREIDAGTMESLLMPGLYFAGEIMDVDGLCGGYNLQWAWTSGYLAGRAAACRRQLYPTLN